MTSAARHAGVSRTSIHDWRHADPEFDKAVEDAYEQGTDLLADHAMRRALLPEHDALLIFMLKQRDPRRFNQRMVELRVSGDADNPVTVSHEHNVAQVLILPDNGRYAMTEAEMNAERQQISAARIHENRLDDDVENAATDQE